MIVPAIGGLASGLGNVTGNLAAGNPEALSGASGAATPAGSASAFGGAQGGGLEGTGGLEGAGGVGGASGTGGASAGEGGGSGFGGALTEAISSLETSQQNASSASQALATGTVSDPEAAVTTVEDAALAMQLAAQIRTKATEAAQTIFNTQV